MALLESLLRIDIGVLNKSIKTIGAKGLFFLIVLTRGIVLLVMFSG